MDAGTGGWVLVHIRDRGKPYRGRMGVLVHIIIIRGKMVRNSGYVFVWFHMRIYCLHMRDKNGGKLTMDVGMCLNSHQM